MNIVFRAIRWSFQLIREGQTKFLLKEIWMQCYKRIHEAWFVIRYRVLGKLSGPKDYQIKLETRHPIAFESPDHLIPFGTSRDNSTNKKFVTYMARRLMEENQGAMLGALDLGCSGGQLVRDFRDFGWIAVGLEGSDFSLKHRRANWPELGGRNLFTCDITKPFQITAAGRPVKFNLITAWEVLEHIPTDSLPSLFQNILLHLETGGYFIATTTSQSDIHDGIDLHQTKWTNPQWREMIAQRYPQLVPVNLGLKSYQFVRHNQENSILVYQRKAD